MLELLDVIGVFYKPGMLSMSTAMGYNIGLLTLSAHSHIFNSLCQPSAVLRCFFFINLAPGSEFDT